MENNEMEELLDYGEPELEEGECYDGGTEESPTHQPGSPERPSAAEAALTTSAAGCRSTALLETPLRPVHSEDTGIRSQKRSLASAPDRYERTSSSCFGACLVFVQLDS